MLNKLRDLIKQKNLNNTEAVISVPPYYTEQEKKALLDAAKIADLKVLRLVNESTAIAMSYGIFRKSELEETNSRNVVFVDLGHSKTSAFLAAFKKDDCKIVT